VMNLKTNSSDVYKGLKHLLVNYRFRPGVQLYPSSLADRFKVSATPIREALFRLSGEKLLDSIPNRGFFSKVLELKEMNDLSIVINALLKHAVIIPCSLDSEIRLDFYANGDSPLSADKPDSCSLSIEHVLVEIASMSGNQVLSDIVRNINDRTHYVWLLDLECERRRKDIQRQIRDLVEYLRTGNVAAALDNLDEQMRRKLALMPVLVKEGLVRSFTAPPPASLLDAVLRSEAPLDSKRAVSFA